MVFWLFVVVCCLLLVVAGMVDTSQGKLFKTNRKRSRKTAKKHVDHEGEKLVRAVLQNLCVVPQRKVRSYARKHACVQHGAEECSEHAQCRA